MVDKPLKKEKVKRKTKPKSSKLYKKKKKRTTRKRSVQVFHGVGKGLMRAPPPKDSKGTLARGNVTININGNADVGTEDDAADATNNTGTVTSSTNSVLPRNSSRNPVNGYPRGAGMSADLARFIDGRGSEADYQLFGDRLFNINENTIRDARDAERDARDARLRHEYGHFDPTLPSSRRPIPAGMRRSQTQIPNSSRQVPNTTQVKNESSSIPIKNESSSTTEYSSPKKQSIAKKVLSPLMVRRTRAHNNTPEKPKNKTKIVPSSSKTGNPVKGVRSSSRIKR